MSTKQPLSDALRRAIAQSRLSYYRLAQDTGVQLTSLMRFVRGETSMRLDLADRLADYLGLEVVGRKPATRQARKRAARKRKG